MDPVSPAPPRQCLRSRSERSLSAPAVKSVGSSSKGRKEARKKSRELDASKDHEPNVHAPEMKLQDQEEHASATVSTVEQPTSETTSISRTVDIEPASKRPRRSARRGSTNGRLALTSVRIAEELPEASEELKEMVGEVRHERGEGDGHAMNGEEDGRMKTRVRSGGNKNRIIISKLIAENTNLTLSLCGTRTFGTGAGSVHGRQRPSAAAAVRTASLASSA
ncbi:hypothetical protein BJ742DRAFT_785366 [Cladochytrium replicatum]|nr:hypothetical protein BJ742DRAFT_785366 [Cladochytrium replicatum]